MNELYAIDESINEYEFRGFVIWYLRKHGYSFDSVDDERLSDEFKNNDNDIKVVKDGVKYTVQVFLNKTINYFRVKETVKDIMEEDVLDGIIFTNTIVSEEEKEKAFEKRVIIYDRNTLREDFHDYKYKKEEL